VSAENSQRRILLVEDNETIRGAFGLLLEDSGYRVLQAASGAEASRLAVEARPHLILMDLGLPDANGLEVTRRLKADPSTRHIPVVAITGRALETDHAACLDAGCSDYITKPVDTVRLLSKVSEYLKV
jgi:two-component system, cell cycle response regulator DivK